MFVKVTKELRLAVVKECVGSSVESLSASSFIATIIIVFLCSVFGSLKFNSISRSWHKNKHVFLVLSEIPALIQLLSSQHSNNGVPRKK